MSEEITEKKIFLKEISVAVIVLRGPMRCARAGRCYVPKALAHTRFKLKYTIFEHVHSKGIHIRIGLSSERDTRYFLLIWIDSLLPRIRNRVTQRLIWLLKIEGLFVGMLLVPRFPGLCAHWAFFRRFEIRNDDRWQAGDLYYVIINRIGYWNYTYHFDGSKRLTVGWVGDEDVNKCKRGQWISA